MHKKNRIAITTTSFGQYNHQPFQLLEAAGVDVVVNPFGRKISGDEIMNLCTGCTGILAGTEIYDRQTLEKLSELKVISRCGVGIDGIDVDAAKDLGIKILNTPFGPTQAVAELTLAMMLNLLRCVSAMDRELRQGLWSKRMGNLLHGKKVGIIGFGRIGRKVAELLEPFGVEIAYTDINSKQNQDKFQEMELNNLLSWADIITLHCSALYSNGPLIGKKEINRIKKGSWIINNSRGGLIDQAVLLEALKDKHLNGAALDVFDCEPYSGSLLDLDNVLMTPHIGSYAVEARVEMELQSVINLLSGLKGLGK